jgi:hypothetical protein
MFRYRLVDQRVPAMWRSLAAARFDGRVAVGKGADHAGPPADLAQDALERIVNRYEKRGADVLLQLSLAAAYGATIRDRGSGSTKVRAGRSVR